MENVYNSFSLSYNVDNQSNEVMVIKLKGGLSYLVRKSKEPTYSTARLLTVRLNSIYLKDLKIDTTMALTSLDKAILEKMKEEQNRLTDDKDVFYGYFTNNIFLTVSLTQELVEADDGIHSEMLGVTFYIGADSLNKPALNTPSHTIKQIVSRNLIKDSLQANVYLNDPKKTFQTLYTNVLGVSREVPVIYNPDETPGLYITFSNNNIPSSQFYTFSELDKGKLETLGFFSSKSECDKGGNTDRYLTAENRIKDLNKTVDSLKDKLSIAEANFNRSEITNSKLNTELLQQKHEHKLEIANLKIGTSQAKFSLEAVKYEAKFKEMVSKSQIDFLKQKSSTGGWVDAASALATVAGIGFTGYRLFSE